MARCERRGRANLLSVVYRRLGLALCSYETPLGDARTVGAKAATLGEACSSGSLRERVRGRLQQGSHVIRSYLGCKDAL